MTASILESHEQANHPLSPRALLPRRRLLPGSSQLNPITPLHSATDRT